MNRIIITGYDDDGGPRKVLGWFDMDKARVIVGEDTYVNSNGNCIGRATGTQWISEELILTAGGRWVLRRNSYIQGQGTTYKYVTDNEAQGWVLMALQPGVEMNDLLDTYWPDTEDESGPEDYEAWGWGQTAPGSEEADDVRRRKEGLPPITND